MDINKKDNDLFKIDESSELNDGKNASDKKAGKGAKKPRRTKRKRVSR